MTTSKWMCGILVVALAIAGPLAPLAAMAQVAPAPPPPGPPPPPPSPPVLHREPGPGAAVGAGFLNTVYVPGKAILCGAGTVAGAGIMLLTFGSAYRAAVTIFNEGCSGHWVLTPYDVTGIRPADEP
jgi:hypothetical protein